MNSYLFASVVLLAPISLLGCVQEGHSADCEFEPGGASAQMLADEGCLTPVGGSCLSEDEFKASRPAKREDSSGDEISVDDDWIAYQCARPLCFDCVTQSEYEENCPDESWSNYLELRPECEE